MKKIIFALGALISVTVLPVAHADEWGGGGGRGWYDTQHIWHDRGELQQAYAKRNHDLHEYWEARANGDWDAMRHERWEIAQDNARIAHERAEIHHYSWDRWHAHHDWDD